MKQTLFATRNDLPAKVRLQVVPLLNQSLAELSDLASQLRQAHWNVRGRYFISLHKFFDELTDIVEGHLDPVAERITTLGGVAHGTVRMAAQASRLPEFPTADAEDLGYVVALIDRFAVCAAALRESIARTAELGDADTADLLTGVSRDLDKSLWLLEAHTRA